MPQTQRTSVTVRRRNGATEALVPAARTENEIRTSFETVSPEQAQAILTKSENAPRRTLSASEIARIKSDIDNERWNPRTNFVSFDKMNRLLDGWHRLTAIATGNRPVTIQVARGFSPREVNDFDRGVQPRRIRHILQFNRYEFPNDGNIISAINRLVTGHMQALPPEQALDMIGKYESDLGWARNTLGGSYKLRAPRGKMVPIPTPIKAALVYAHHNAEQRSDVEAFAVKFTSLPFETKNTDGDPVKALRSQFEEGFFRGGGTLAQLGSMLRTLRAVNAYILGDAIPKLHTPRVDEAKALVERFA